MRIISQNDVICIPIDAFETFVGRLDENKLFGVWIRPVYYDRRGCTQIAEYSTKEKADKAVELMRMAYSDAKCRIWKFPQDDAVEV